MRASGSGFSASAGNPKAIRPKGTPAQKIKHYMDLASRAQAEGDEVSYHNYRQHAEHYLRASQSRC